MKSEHFAIAIASGTALGVHYAQTNSIAQSIAVAVVAGIIAKLFHKALN